METLVSGVNVGTGRADPLQVLLESSAILLATSSQEAVLAGILDVASRVLAADAYAVWRDIDGHGTWRAVATRGLSPTYRTEIRGARVELPMSIQVIEDAASEEVLAQFEEVYAAEGVRSLLVVPLAIQDDRAATITFYWRRTRKFSPLDLDYASALANLSTAALNRNELHMQNQRERRRLAFLAEASAVLASSLDYETTLNRVAKLAVPHISDWCTVHVLENGKPNRIVVAHADPEMLSLAEEYSLRYPEEIRQDRGLGAVLHTGRTEVFAEITDEMLVGAARDPEHLEVLRSLQMTSSILVPLISRGTVLGAIRLLAGGSNRYFTAEDVQLAEDLAHRAATAIENAQLHRAVIRQESQLRLSHSAARMGSWSWDLVKGEISWSNEFKQLHDLPIEMQPAFDSGSSLIHPEDREGVIGQLQSALESDRQHIQFEHRSMTHAGRTIWVQSRATIQRDEAGKALSISGISMDVTEARLAEDTLRRTEKLAAAGRLAATVAHEVNNPLEALTNLIFLASSVEDLPKEAKEYLLTADGELRRMAHVVRQTLGFYRETAEPCPVDLGRVVAEIMDLYQSRAQTRSVRLTHVADAGAMALANAGEIKQVVANLVSNAIDASAGGSVETHVRRKGPEVEIVVSDNGTGISDKHLAKVFEPFFTTKSEVGTGLGLWVSKGIVEKHKGSVRIVSTTDPGTSGTRIVVRLPAFEVGP